MYQVALGILLIDQAIVWYLTKIAPTEPVVSDRWFILVNQPTGSMVSLVIVVALIIAAILTKRHSWRIPLGLVLGGAVSNILTFLKYGGAFDFIPLRGAVYGNVADLAISGGLIWLGILILLEHTKKPPFGDSSSPV